jgi:hypothetical protein
MISHGGEKGISYFSNFEATGELELFFGIRSFKGDFTIIKKGRKSLLKSEFAFGGSKMKMVRAFDGRNAWMEQRGNISDQPALNSQSELDHTPLLLLEKEATFSLGEKTEIDGVKVIGIVVDSNNKKTTFYIDQSNNTIREIRYSDLFYGDTFNKEIIEQRIRFLDYKRIKEILFPSRIAYFQKSKKQMEMNFKDIRFDPKVTSDIFERPDHELDLRTREESYH